VPPEPDKNAEEFEAIRETLWLEIVKEARAVTDRVKEGRDNKDPLA